MECFGDLISTSRIFISIVLEVQEEVTELTNPAEALLHKGSDLYYRVSVVESLTFGTLVPLPRLSLPVVSLCINIRCAMIRQAVGVFVVVVLTLCVWSSRQMIHRRPGRHLEPQLLLLGQTCPHQHHRRDIRSLTDYIWTPKQLSKLTSGAASMSICSTRISRSRTSTLPMHLLA